jgi:hypothetical protein
MVLAIATACIELICRENLTWCSSLDGGRSLSTAVSGMGTNAGWDACRSPASNTGARRSEATTSVMSATSDACVACAGEFWCCGSANCENLIQSLAEYRSSWKPDVATEPPRSTFDICSPQGSVRYFSTVRHLFRKRFTLRV